MQEKARTNTQYSKNEVTLLKSLNDQKKPILGLNFKVP